MLLSSILFQMQPLLKWKKRKQKAISSKDRENLLSTNMTLKMKLNFKRTSFCNLVLHKLWWEFSEGRENNQLFSSWRPKMCEKLCYKLQCLRQKNDRNNHWNPRKQLISFILKSRLTLYVLSWPRISLLW